MLVDEHAHNLSRRAELHRVVEEVQHHLPNPSATRGRAPPVCRRELDLRATRTASGVKPSTSRAPAARDRHSAGGALGTARDDGSTRRFPPATQAPRLLADDLQRAPPFLGTADAVEHQRSANMRICASGVRSSCDTPVTKSARSRASPLPRDLPEADRHSTALTAGRPNTSTRPSRRVFRPQPRDERRRQRCVDTHPTEVSARSRFRTPAVRGCARRHEQRGAGGVPTCDESAAASRPRRARRQQRARSCVFESTFSSARATHETEVSAARSNMRSRVRQRCARQCRTPRLARRAPRLARAGTAEPTPASIALAPSTENTRASCWIVSGVSRPDRSTMVPPAAPRPIRDPLERRASHGSAPAFRSGWTALERARVTLSIPSAPRARTPRRRLRVLPQHGVAGGLALPRGGRRLPGQRAGDEHRGDENGHDRPVAHSRGL